MYCVRLPSLSIFSGGNAGLAAAYIARELGVHITVVIPGRTPSFIEKRLREEGATVEVVGEVIERHSCTQPYVCSLEGISMHARGYNKVYSMSCERHWYGFYGGKYVTETCSCDSHTSPVCRYGMMPTREPWS